MKAPVGEDMKKLLLNSSPTITYHEGRLKGDNNLRPRVFQNIDFNETQISEQSFGDLSLMSGDVSCHVMKDVKRY